VFPTRRFTQPTIKRNHSARRKVTVKRGGIKGKRRTGESSLKREEKNPTRSYLDVGGESAPEKGSVCPSIFSRPRKPRKGPSKKLYSVKERNRGLLEPNLSSRRKRKNGSWRENPEGKRKTLRRWLARGKGGGACHLVGLRER